MHLRNLPTPLFLIAVALLLLPRSAWAWVEMHTTAHDVRVELSRQGSATVEHTVTLRIAGGPLRTFDLKIADKNVRLTEETFLTAAKDGITSKDPIPVTVEQRPDGDLRLEIDGKRGVGHGIYEVRVKYEVDLLQQEMVRRDGSMLRVTWVGPSFADGVDNVRCTFAVPSSPTEPRVADDSRADGQSGASTAAGGTFLTALSRTPQFDELALTRPHVARLEAVPWSIRIDPRALGDVGDPRLRAPASTAEVQMPSERRAMLLGLCAFLAVLISGVVAIKHRQVVQACTSVGLVARPLAPVGLAVRVALAGPVLVGGIALQCVQDNPIIGAFVALVGVALVAYRSPKAMVSPRGPGRWLPLSDTDALSTTGKSSGWLDASATWGKISLVITLVVIGVACFFLYRFSPYHAHLVALNAVAVFALFGTGMASRMPIPGALASGSMLARVATALRKNKKALQGRVKAIGRFPVGCAKADEVRLVVSPRPAPQGLISLEVGVAWIDGTGGPVGLPEILVRVHEGSDCHEKLTKSYPKSRWVRGRESYEKVLCVTPALPLVEHTVSAVADVLKSLRPQVQSAKKEQSAKKPAPRQKAATRTRSAAMTGLPMQESW